MTDKENIKQKIKAIYPHIVVGGDIDKPCYTIHWYDIEQKTMICGFGSYKLELVRKWLEEEFEIVERDIDGLLYQQQAEIEKLKKLLDGAETCIDELEYALDKVGHSNSRVDDALENYNNIVKEKR